MHYNEKSRRELESFVEIATPVVCEWEYHSECPPADTATLLKAFIAADCNTEDRMVIAMSELTGQFERFNVRMVLGSHCGRLWNQRPDGTYYLTKTI